jgi:hypothetical protein
VCALLWPLIRPHDHPQGSAFGEVSGLNECYTQSLKDDFHKPENAHREEEEEKMKKKKKKRKTKTKERRYLIVLHLKLFDEDG